MRKLTTIGLALLLWLAAMPGAYAQCNAPSSASVFTNHYPDWYSVSVGWDAPEGGSETGNEDGNSSVVLYNRGVGTGYISVIGKTTLGATATFNNLGIMNSQIQCMEYVNGIVYAVDKSGTNGRFGYFEPQTIGAGAGGFYLIGTDLPDIASMAWNPVTSEMYVTLWSADNENLSGYGKINIETGEYTPLGTLPGIFSIAIDNDGVCHAVRIGNTGKYGTIDLAAGVFSQKISYPEVLAYYQNVEVNRKTNKLYWNRRIYNAGNSNAALYEIDRTTGNLTAGSTLMGENFPAVAFAIMDAASDSQPRYNVYRNSVKLNSQPLFTPFYRDLAPAGGTFNYCVEAVYSNPECTSEQACADPFVMPANDCSTPLPLPLSEGFNKASNFPPYCWTLSAGNPIWQHATNGSLPTCSPQEGTGMIRFDSNNANSGSIQSFITPAFETGGKDRILSFWLYRYLDPNKPAAADRISIYVSSTTSTAGLTPLLTVHRSNVLSPVVEANGWYQYYVKLPCAGMSSAHVMFEGYSDFGRFIYMDNFVIGDICVPVQSVTASLDENSHAIVAWTAPAAVNPSLTGYSVYRNGELIAENITALEYSDEDDLTAGQYTYSVKAVYDNDCGLSDARNADPLMVTTGCNDAAAPVNLKTELHLSDWYDVKLTWENPVKKELFYTRQHDNEFGAAQGTAGTFTMVSRWTPDDLTRINGYSLNKISFVPAASECTYTVKIWQGGTAINNPGTLATEQLLTTASLQMGQWNEITLTDPVVIDATKELWIGVQFEVQSGYPAGINTTGTVTPGYSDLALWTTGEWVSLQDKWGLAYNWCLGATVGTGSETEEVIGYNVYKNNTLLNTAGYVQGTVWQDNVQAAGSYTYEVSTLYDNFCESPRTQVVVEMEQNPCETPSQGFTESFEGDRFPSWCWDNISTTAAPWKKIIGMGTQPECPPYEGNAMIQYNCRNITAGKTGLLITPAMETGQHYKLSFWMARDDAYADSPDRVNIYLGNTKDVTGLTPILTIHRHVALPPAVTDNLWYEYSAEVATAGMDAAYFIFEGVTAYGGNIYIDQISVEKLPCTAPANVSVETSYSGSCSALVTWTDAAGGNGVYNIYRDNELVAAGIADTSYVDTGFTLGEEHTWCVKSICGSDESESVCAAATCELPKFNITLSANENGTVSPSESQIVTYGESATFTFAANEGYEIGRLLIDGQYSEDVAVAGTYTFENVTDDHTLAITFRALPVAPQASESGIFYVKADGTGNGSSWAEAAYDLQTVINAAAEGNRIWVAAGAYKPRFKAAEYGFNTARTDSTEATNRYRAFVMKKGVQLYGGFAGTETALAERVLSPDNASILSGDFNENDLGAPAGNNTTMRDNAYHVVIFAGEMGNASLDGFTITGGYANQVFPYVYMLVSESILEQRCGGGVYCDNASPAFTNVIFRGNYSAPNGAAMYNNMASPVLINVLFTGNVDNNGAGNAIYNKSASPVLTNVTIYGNKPGAYGNAITNNTASAPVIRNSILFNNGTSASVNNLSSSSVTYVNSYVQGVTAEGVILSGVPNPLFEDAANGNFQLSAISPCIDAGSNTVFDANGTPNLSAVTADLAGNPRIHNSTADLGAYEYQGTATIFTPDANGVIFITEEGAGLKDGSSWSNAAEGLSNVLFLAPAISNLQQIWVKEGTYTPAYMAGNGTTPRDRTFLLPGSVHIYGSFAGTETSLAERTLSGGITSVLSGDLDGNDDGTEEMFAENAHHVVMAIGDVATAGLDGFVVTKGYANATNTITVNTVSAIARNNGAGLFIRNASPVLTNLVVTENRAINQGGGIYLNTSLSPISNITVSNNTASNGATGGMGGGIYMQSGSDVPITNTIITGNVALVQGGGIHAACSPVLTNVLISNNSATGTNTGVNGNGGGINIASGTPVLTNVTVTGNSANSLGGGLNTATAAVKVRNSIVFGNTFGSTSGNIHATAPNATYSYSLIGDSNWTTVAIDGGSNAEAGADPLFVDAEGGDFRLKAGSPAMDAGNSTLFDAEQTPDLSAITADLAGNPRIADITGNAVDMGAYEAQSLLHTITALAGENGAVSPSGIVAVSDGESQPFAITPNRGYAVSQVLVDNVNNSEAALSGSYTFTDVTADHTIEAQFEPQTFTVTVSANVEAGGSVNGGGNYTYGVTATVTATASAGYNFVSWTEEGEVVSADAEYLFVVEGNRNLVANFALKTYTVDASSNPEAGGSITGANTYEHGEQATLTATANTGYTFVRWTENGTEVSASAAYTFTVTGNRTLVAVFTLNTYTVNVSASPADGGWISLSNTYSHGTQVTVTAEANPGYNFVNWTEDGDEVSPDAEYTFTVTDNRNLVANFALITYTIAVSATEGGSVSGGNTYAHGEQATVTATPATNYTFVNWTEDGIEVTDAEAEYTFTVTGDRTLVANFALQQFEVTYSQPENGELAVTANDVPVASGNMVDWGIGLIIKAAPAQGYKLESLTVNGVDFASGSTHTVVGNVNIECTFTDDSGIDDNTLTGITVYGSGNTVYIVNKNSVTLKSVQITDVLGRVVYDGKANGSVTIPVNGASGIYVVRLLSDDNKVLSTKVHLTR